jgi:Uracil DNA glycosylase superfamily
MADSAFRADQWNHRFEPHIAPINHYVDEIRGLGYGWAPYVAPIHGGVDARVLSILRDPGPATQDGKAGSGFLCVENDDASAELQCELLGHAGLVAKDILPWNAYPWYINRKPSTAELLLGLPTILQVLELAPAIQVVVLQGADAQASWKLLQRQHPQTIRTRRLAVVETYHPSRQALFTPDPAEQERRRTRRFEAFRDIADALK